LTDASNVASDSESTSVRRSIPFAQLVASGILPMGHRLEANATQLIESASPVSQSGGT
jgi:hypothetical protein